jgi:hypothetical protein
MTPFIRAVPKEMFASSPIARLRHVRVRGTSVWFGSVIETETTASPSLCRRAPKQPEYLLYEACIPVDRQVGA